MLWNDIQKARIIDIQFFSSFYTGQSYQINETTLYELNEARV